MITSADVLAASDRIRSHIRRTPMLRGGPPEAPVWFKCEFMQHTGVFKARGAFNRILAAAERGALNREVGLVVASGGNAGLANAFAAAALGVPATVFVPLTAPKVKLDRIATYGATVHQVGREYADAYAAAIDFTHQRDALFCHAYDQVEIAAGAGTISEEIFDDLPNVDTIVVAVGGGGLFARVTASAEGRAQVVAVEPLTIPTLHSALQAGVPVDVSVSGVAADALGARRVGDIAFEVASRVTPTSVLVDDEAIIDARELLWADYRIPAEYGAATAYAALTSRGANTDLRTLDGPNDRS